MMGLKVYLLIALAVSCHGLPRTTEDVVPERQTMLLQHTAAFTTMSPTAFISAMTSSGGNEATCRSFADETIKTIDKTVTSTQGEVDAIETGHSCAALGQDAVKAEEAKVAAAKLVVQNAKADVASKTIAKDTAASAPYTVTFDLMSTSQPNCLDVSGESSYLAVKNARDTAIAELEAAVTALTAANTKVTGTEASLATVVTEASRLESGCLCRIHKEQKAAWAEASTATAAHAADWKSAHEIICALDKTTTCTVPTCPTLTKPTLAAGVSDAACTGVTSQYAVTGAALNSDPASSLGVTWIVSPGPGAPGGSLGNTCNAVCNSQSGSSCVREGIRLVALQSNCAFQMAATGSSGCTLCTPSGSTNDYCFPGQSADGGSYYDSSWSTASFTCDTAFDRELQILCPCTHQ